MRYRLNSQSNKKQSWDYRLEWWALSLSTAFILTIWVSRQFGYWVMNSEDYWGEITGPDKLLSWLWLVALFMDVVLLKAYLNDSLQGIQQTILEKKMKKLLVGLEKKQNPEKRTRSSKNKIIL